MSSAVLLDQAADPAQGVVAEILAGLHATPRTLPCKLFYDEAGALLFERICATDAYYPTRTEIAILRRHGGEMARALGPRCRLLELGSGSGIKTRILLRQMRDPAEYIPVDISGEQLAAFAAELRAAFPELRVCPLRADYTRPLTLPPTEGDVRTAAFFPGSTIGNFTPADAIRFLGRIRGVLGAGGLLLLGVDLRKDPERLERAYNDEDGVTAAFNLNILRHVNRLCGADFDPDRFAHRAFYQETEGRIEMHLVSLCAQSVSLGQSGGAALQLTEGEAIVTEYSYKYDVPGFAALAAEAGFAVREVWTDPERLFSVQLLEAL